MAGQKAQGEGRNNELGLRKSGLRPDGLTFFLCKLGLMRGILPTLELVRTKRDHECHHRQHPANVTNSELLPLTHCLVVSNHEGRYLGMFVTLCLSLLDGPHGVQPAGRKMQRQVTRDQVQVYLCQRLVPAPPRQDGSGALALSSR